MYSEIYITKIHTKKEFAFLRNHFYRLIRNKVFIRNQTRLYYFSII